MKQLFFKKLNLLFFIVNFFFVLMSNEVYAHTLSLNTDYSFVGNVHIYNLDGEAIVREITNSNVRFSSNGVMNANIETDGSSFNLSLGFPTDSFTNHNSFYLSPAYTRLAERIIGHLGSDNEYNPNFDINRDGYISALDALLIINDVNRGFMPDERTFGTIQNSNTGSGFAEFNFLASKMESRLWSNNYMTIWYSQYDPSGRFLGHGDMTLKVVDNVGTEIPEPGSLLLFGSAALMAFSRKRRLANKIN